jgi:predicted nuclease with TOPRIM domain
LLLEAISKINDPELKANMLHKLRKMLNKEKTNDFKTTKPTISLSKTLERFNKLKPKKVNLKYLQLEVNQIKNEIKQLKNENNKLESKNANLEDRVSILELNKKLVANLCDAQKMN